MGVEDRLAELDGLARAATKVAGQIQHGHGLTEGETRNTKEGWQSGKCSRATTANEGLGSRNKSKGDVRAEKLFKHFQRVFKELKVQKAILHDSRVRLNLQVNHKNRYQQSNSVSNAAAIFSPHRCRVTIFAGVLPAAPPHPHRGLQVGGLPQSTFGATVHALVTVAVCKAPASRSASSSTSISMVGRIPAARGTSTFWGVKGSNKDHGRNRAR